MHLQQLKSSLRLAGLAVLGLASASGQVQDTSGNALLKGVYHFRHVAVQNVDTNYNPTEVTAIYGTITFDGAGNYVLAGTSMDNTVSSGAPQVLNVTSTYAIGSNGLGYIVNPIFPNDPDAFIYGSVSQGVYTGSSTESEGDDNIFNDLFIAIPGGTIPTNASFTSPYQSGLLDFAGGGSSAIKNALFELTPNGAGAFGTISLSGQAANSRFSTVTQSITGATYSFNADGSATLTIPLPSGATATSALFTGSKTIFQSADGNFILGWTSTGYDIFFGVKALTVSATNSLSDGLYFTAAVEDSPDVSGTDSFYGSINLFGDAAGDGILHERVNLADASSYDYGSDDQIELNSNGTTGADFNGYEYIFGDGGQAFVAVGTSGNYSLVVGMHAAKFSGAGVYINPIGIVNAASYQPITASLAPGELITLFGSGLASSTVTAPPGGFPTTLGGVSVTIDNIPCPIYYVSPGQMSVIVPYEVALNQTGLANIQVSSNGVLSNVVQMYLSDSAPGSFSQNLAGIGYAAALHSANNTLITPANPAQPGEYISLYLTGLGTVSPPITDGAPGPSTTLSWSDLYDAGNLTVLFNDYANGTAGNAGTIEFAGLAPTLVGLYQINVQVPSDGLVAGDNVYIEFVTDAADVDQIQIPYGAGAVTPTDVPARSQTEALAGAKARAARFKAIRAKGRSRTASRPRGSFVTANPQ